MKTVLIALSMLMGVAVTAQTYSIGWYKIAGGGGTSTNGAYSVSGTIGQHDASGVMAGGSFSMTGGYWSLINVAQTPGAPTLFITRGSNTVTVYWQTTSVWNLQQSPNLAVATGWTASAGVIAANGSNYLSVTNPAGSMFFRLKHP